LNPSGFGFSYALGNYGSQQIGWGDGPATANDEHALLWSGTANSVIDLNPSGFEVTFGRAISGSEHVGSGFGPATGDNYHALLWLGTADSVMDLHAFLTADYINSEALGIDANGNILGYATYIPDGSLHAILWSVVPEPGSLTLCLLAGIALVMRKRILSI
jgi:hypothetical protein